MWRSTPRVRRSLDPDQIVSPHLPQGRGVSTIVRGLEAALAIVRVESTRLCRDAGRDLDAELLRDAFRCADFILNHLAVGEDLAEAWSSAEA